MVAWKQNQATDRTLTTTFTLQLCNAAALDGKKNKHPLTHPHDRPDLLDVGHDELETKG